MSLKENDIYFEHLAEQWEEVNCEIQRYIFHLKNSFPNRTEDELYRWRINSYQYNFLVTMLDGITNEIQKYIK